MGCTCSTYGERTGAHRVLVGKPEVKRPFGRTRRRWKDNIKIEFQELGWGMDLIVLAQKRNRGRGVVNAVMNHWVP